MTPRRIGPLSFVFTALATLFLCNPATAEYEAYLVFDQGQTPIVGQLTTPDGVEEAIAVTEFHHLVRREPNPGGCGGCDPYTPPQHRPLVVTTPVGMSTAQLFQAFTNGDLVDVTLKLYGTGQQGLELKFEITLQEGLIVAIEPVSLTTNGAVYEYQKLRFIYRTLIVSDAATGLDMQWQLPSWPF